MCCEFFTLCIPLPRCSLAVTSALSPTKGATIYASVCNTAGPAAAEVAQLYLGYPAAAGEPPKLLKGFQKVQVGPGSCEGVAFPLSAADLSVWNVAAQAWQLIPGSYAISVGSSSRDIRVTGTLIVNAQ